MTERNLKRILVGVGVLVLLYLGISLLTRGSGDADARRDEGISDLLSSLSEEEIGHIDFVSDSEKVTLTREDGRWLVNGHPTDPSRIDDFWNDLSELPPSDVVAASPVNHARLGVHDDSATLIIFHGPDGSSTTLLIGKSGPSWPSVYLRIPEEDPVYLVRTDLRTVAHRAAGEWRDKVATRVDTAAIRTLRVVREEERYELVRRDGAWWIGSDSANAETIGALLDELSEVRVTSFAADTATMPEATRSLVALDEKGDSLAVLAMAKTEGVNVWVSLPGDETIYEVATFRADRLTPRKEEVGKAPDE